MQRSHAGRARLNPQDPLASQRAPENPRFDTIPHRKGATNLVPTFITRYGPFRRFPTLAIGQLPQRGPRTTGLETESRRDNLRFRLPLQQFRLGILDGMPKRSGNDGTITRFGWKAQNKSIAIFAAEAHDVEMGVTNDLFTQATDEVPTCTADKSERNDIRDSMAMTRATRPWRILCTNLQIG